MLNTYYIDSDNCLSVETDLTLDPNVQTAEGTFCLLYTSRCV